MATRDADEVLRARAVPLVEAVGALLDGYVDLHALGQAEESDLCTEMTDVVVAYLRGEAPWRRADDGDVTE